MAGTPTLATRILGRLTSDSSLTALLVGGIYDRELKREGPGSTPTAFAPTPPFQIRPAAVVRDDGDADDTLGPRGARFSFVTIYVYAPATANGKDAIATALAMIEVLLIDWRMPTPNGTGATAEIVAARLGVRDDPVLMGTVMDYDRFQINALSRLYG